MTTPVTSPETALQRERRLFHELRSRLIDAILSRIFDLRPQKAARRMFYLSILFLFSGSLITLIYYPLSNWIFYLGQIFDAALATQSPASIDIAINDFLNFFSRVITDSRILQYLPILVAPFFIALQSAAIYLADIFELEDPGVARQFISAVALTGSDRTIRIMKGEISEEHKETPTFLIGGPGKVMVDLDSVALFEKADGTPHVIGPTGKEPGGKATLEGFERFRQAFDIRDHYVFLRDQDQKSKAVHSRSRDGIPVTATDVRLMFSVFRGENPQPSEEYPYEFNKEAIERIVYRASSRVTPELPSPSTFEFSWINNMISLIRGKLGGFMSEHNLTAYLASIGMPEFEKAKRREEKILEQVQQLTQSSDDTQGQKEIKPPPEFQYRYKVKNLFEKFTDDFTKKALENGVELHWIGVGTWETPDVIVPQNHLEAWEISQKNLKEDSTEEMGKIEQKAIVEKMKELIRQVPLTGYEEILDDTKYMKRSGKLSPKRHRKPDFHEHETEDNNDDQIFPDEEMGQFAEMLQILQDIREGNIAEQEKDPDHYNDMKKLLWEYKKQFTETVEFIKARGEPAPQNIQEAIKHIENQIAHWAGRH